MQDINISLIQTAIAWEDKKSNLKKFSLLIDSIGEKTDIIILPEMFSTGFTMDPENVAEGMNGEAVEWMKAQSAKYNSVITGSLVINEKDNFYNRLIWMKPDGTFNYYDKKHLFTLAGENRQYSSGNKKLIVENKGWKICPLICYDLRFPVWIRNKENYDLLIFVANWPVTRIEHWEHLMFSRAIENQCYVAGVNRIGHDAPGINYNGTSLVIDPFGKLIKMAGNEETVVTLKLQYSAIEKARKELPFLNDIDKFEIL